MWCRASAPVGLLFSATLALAGDPVYVSIFSQNPVPMQERLADADRYALTSRLAVLRNGARDEVRFWVTAATFMPPNGIETVGYVVTENSSRVCHVGYSGKSTVPKNGRCRAYSPHESRKRIVADLSRLSEFTSVSVDCGVLDGAWVLIDGVSNGKRFAIWANNPQSCGGDEAHLVSELLREVAEQSS